MLFVVDAEVVSKSAEDGLENATAVIARIFRESGADSVAEKDGHFYASSDMFVTVQSRGMIYKQTRQVMFVGSVINEDANVMPATEA